MLDAILNIIGFNCVANQHFQRISDVTNTMCFRCIGGVLAL